MIAQYLEDEGYTASAMMVQDESNVRLSQQANRQQLSKKMKKAILGKWEEQEVEKEVNLLPRR